MSGLLARNRMEEQELPQIEALAHQRYKPVEKDPLNGPGDFSSSTPFRCAPTGVRHKGGAEGRAARKRAAMGHALMKVKVPKIIHEMIANVEQATLEEQELLLQVERTPEEEQDRRARMGHQPFSTTRIGGGVGKEKSDEDALRLGEPRTPLGSARGSSRSMSSQKSSQASYRSSRHALKGGPPSQNPHHCGRTTRPEVGGVQGDSARSSMEDGEGEEEGGSSSHRAGNVSPSGISTISPATPREAELHGVVLGPFAGPKGSGGGGGRSLGPTAATPSGHGKGGGGGGGSVSRRVAEMMISSAKSLAPLSPIQKVNGVAVKTYVDPNSGTRAATALRKIEAAVNASPSSRVGSLGRCFSERVGILYHPLSNVRTPYQEEELVQLGRPPTVLDQEHADPSYKRGRKGLGDPPPKRIFFDLESFDRPEFEKHTPEEWVELGSVTGGTPARSRYHDQTTKKTTWEACRVVSYNPETDTFYLLWNEHPNQGKWTKRLNIIFDAESEGAWKERIRSADNYRHETEITLRQQLYIQSLPNSLVPPMPQSQMESILRLVSKRFKVQFLSIVEQCTREVEQVYCQALKKAIHLYDLRDVKEQRRLKDYEVPKPKELPILSLTTLKGPIDTPSPNYRVVADFLEDNVFQVHSLLYNTLHSIHTLWNDYRERKLCLSTFFTTEPIPLHLHRFLDLQMQQGTGVSEKLRGEWSSTVHATIQNNLDPYFNFYEDNMERFQVSRMHRFIKLVNVMMSTQLRALMVRSIEEYADFIYAHRVKRKRRRNNCSSTFPLLSDTAKSPREGGGGSGGDEMEKGAEKCDLPQAHTLGPSSGEISTRFDLGEDDDDDDDEEEMEEGDKLEKAQRKENGREEDSMDDEEYEEEELDELPEDAAEREYWIQREAKLAVPVSEPTEGKKGNTNATAAGGGSGEGNLNNSGTSGSRRRRSESSTIGDEDRGGGGVADLSRRTSTCSAGPVAGDIPGADGYGKEASAPLRFVWRMGTHTYQTPLYRRVVNCTMKINNFHPKFYVQLVEKNQQVLFEPSLETWTDEVMKVVNRCFEYSDGISAMGDQLFPLLELPVVYLKALSPDEPAVVRAKQRIMKSLNANLIAPQQLQDMYRAFEYILKTNIPELVQEAVKEQLSLEDYDLVLERLNRDVDRIMRRTVSQVKYQLFHIDCQRIKEVLIKKAYRIMNGLMESLAQRLRADNDYVLKEYEGIMQRSSVEPTTPEELQELRRYLDGVPALEEKLQQVFDHVTAGNELLMRYRYIVPHEDFVRYWVGYEWPKKLLQHMEDRKFRCKEFRTIFMQNLRDDCEKLSMDIMQLGTAVEEFTHYGEDARAEEYDERAKEMEATMAEYQELVHRYNSHEELFQMPVTQYPQLKEMKANFEPYSTLWSIASSFNAESERWLSVRIAALNPTDVDSKLTDWSKQLGIIAKKIKETEPTEVLKRLREHIERFKPNVPLLYALRSNLQATHWRAIYQACGIPKEKQGFGPGGVDTNDQRPFVEFLKLDMLQHMSQIENIASLAQKTFELESELMTMESEWKKLLFEMEPYQDTYKLKANETMQLTLDEHLLKTQSMLGKPIVRQAPALQARVTQWERQLDNIQTIMDEWFRCQNTWAYLEPIFSSQDISRSLPTEKHQFVGVDNNWHSIMEGTRLTPQVLARCQDESLLRTLSDSNNTLEVVLRKLQQFLETKRMAFPRFYFISNEELLQILSDSKDPYLVQPYLCKCFEGIKRIEFSGRHDIVGMMSAEGEHVKLVKKVNPGDHGNQVELWLQAVENVMIETIRDQLLQAIGDYATRKRVNFIRSWPGQVVIAICCYFWTMEATKAMSEEGTVGLMTYHETCIHQLEDLIRLVRDKNLAVVERCTLESLVVIEVHAKDIIGMLCERGVDSPTNFDWLAQLRYYWEENNHLMVRQINAELRYGYEYLGNTGRLVITPLTDRCYRTLIGALHLNYGGAPEGPAGTGKTETTKDLAKALGKYCVVYNCSDQISAKDMAKLFKGLSQAGAWGCFDEFNRIEIQVLSVIAQQVATIQESIVQKRTEFMFDGALIKLNSGCAIFVTMNPGYAGRAELPDNLKALFRPVAMMVPNYAMIGEIQLYSYGFLHGKVLSEKIVATYRLCSEQLSSQDHYDYGMRAVKSVLTAAGRLKRTYPDEDEMILLLRSIQDVNLPKFLTQDVELFKGIISDLFPGVTLPAPDYNAMHNAMVKVCRRRNLQLTSYFEIKMQQTYEMICVRHGMMIVGYSFGGKTKALQCLSEALGEMEISGKGENRTRLVTINPKSVTMSQLYGKVEQSGEWTDGILSNRFRQIANDSSTDRKWLVLDGPVDAVWIENMNTVLDDNKKLCLQNGDIIPMSKSMNLVFEVQDLQHASPATVSRCGMVYVEPDSLGWRCLIQSYLKSMPDYIRGEERLSDAFEKMVDTFLPEMLEFVRKRTQTVIPQGSSTAVASFIKLFQCFTKEFNEEAAAQKVADPPTHERLMLMRIEGWFLFSLLWSVGGCLFTKDRIQFSARLHELIAERVDTYKFSLTIFEKTISFYDMRLSDTITEVHYFNWSESVPDINIDETAEYQDITIPTTDTAKCTFLIGRMIQNHHPGLLVGDTGTGKTIMMKALLTQLPKESFSINMIQFSAQTTSGHLQKLIDSSCEKRRKGYYGPPINKRLMVFIDDANLPQLEEYGAQPPIELLRQFLDHGGWYNHSKDGIEFRHVLDSLLVCAMGPAGGGRNPLTQRFTRHFNVFSVPMFDEVTLKKIFGRLSDWILSKGFPTALRAFSSPLVAATVELYETLMQTLKPSPEKSHYTFNLRDASKVFQGVDMANPARITDEMKLAELWTHEVHRAFADRFINDHDTSWFSKQAGDICMKHFKVAPRTDPGSGPILFSTFMNEEGAYEKLPDSVEARNVLESKLDNYNVATRTGELNLVIFNYVLEHVARISRVLLQPGGHLLLVGVGGSGRRSCTKLAAYVQECDYRTITVLKEYDHDDFLDDIRSLLIQTGQKGYSTALVMSDTQIIEETFLEDICSLLNTSEIPGLWDSKQEKEMYENAVATLREVGRSLGRPDTQEALQQLFVERCRKHMHIVLCFSPLGSVLRDRLRKFPSLVNCTTIDWFREWPEDGLSSVATRLLSEEDLTDEEKSAICPMFVSFQQQIRDMGVKYLAEARQHTYVTPTSYLDLLSTFARLLKEKRSELQAMQQRYTNGLAQLKKTEDQVEVMQRELAVMQPQLAVKAKETAALIQQVEKESKIAEEQRALVAVDEAAANETATAAKKIKDASQEKVDEAQPYVEEAERAVQDLDPKQLQEVKALKAPPEGVKYVIEVLCTLLGGNYKPKAKRDPLTGKMTIPYWEHAKVVLLTGEFKNILLTSYPIIVDTAPDSQIEEVKKKMQGPLFKMEKIVKTSQALVGVAKYINAVVEYYKQNKIIKPLLAQAAAAQAEFEEAMTGLNKKKEELRVIDEKLGALNRNLDAVNKEKQALEEKVNDTNVKLIRAKKLIEGLGGEKVRFAKEAKRFKDELVYVVGNVVVSAGIVAYLGPFLNKYRVEATNLWVSLCRRHSITVSENFSLERFCGNPLDIQNWKLQQLPTDTFSISNAVIMKNSSRWPLLVDPQQQANSWIRNMEREHNLLVLRPSEADYLRGIRQAISQGRPVLLENVDETLDPMLENLLLKRLTKEGAMLVIHLGEAVEWNEDFRFYMTTKLPRPHYLPEVSTKVTLINFMITQEGLQDQLLQRVMLSERRDVEEKKQALTLEAASNQAGLKNTEDRILAILSSEGNILESEEAINELDNAKEQSDRIAKRQEEIDVMERISDRTRNQFIPVAHLGAVLFFCVTELGNIDPMYQNSLQSYISIFQEGLVSSEKSSVVEERIKHINNTFKTSLYQRICRSLFARDQLLFSFIMSLKIFEVPSTLLRWVLMGGFEAEVKAENPFPWLPKQNWTMVARASMQLPVFRGLIEVMREKELFFRDYYESSNPLEYPLPAPYDTLSPMENMVIVRCLRTDKIVPAVTDYVCKTLGAFFVEPPLYALETVVEELAYDPSVPIILVLSPGADPNAELDRVAEVKGMFENRLRKLSLGQGQDVPARELISEGTALGHWVLLQNCHLYADFMPELSRIIENYSDLTTKEKLHREYRLWLTSLPSEIFPIVILQNGVKLVQEPPKGLKSNLLQSYLTDPVADEEFFNGSNKPEIWGKMLFGLCFFHAVVQERRQYGPLGWNRPYEFNDTDRRISVRQLQMFLNENESVPYDALLYLVGQCNYGGRVTDDWDRRCLMASLQVYFNPFILEDDYLFCDDADSYYAPPFGPYSSYVTYIQGLPLQQPPSIFGLHENANITKDERDARFLLDSTLSTQPREAPVGGGGEASGDEGSGKGEGGPNANKMDPKTTVRTLAAEVFGRLPTLFDVEEIQKTFPIQYEQSMNTVLLQEAIRYNRLLQVVRRTLVEVQDAILGKVVMSSELEAVFTHMYDGKVPEVWMKRSYPSLKPFGAYVADLIERLAFLRRWCEMGPPVMFWLSGFYFTQSFLTGVMQNFARKYRIEIDKLVWEFTVKKESKEEIHDAPEDGCFIYGLFLEGANWNSDSGVLCESRPKELFISFPVLQLTPSKPENVKRGTIYECPCYKTTDRRGVLSTTGHSTNFILTIDLPRDPSDTENHWVLRGTALFTQLEF